MKTIKIISLLLFLTINLFSQEYKIKKISIEESFFLKPNPNHELWNQITFKKINLMPQNITSPSLQKRTVPYVEFKSFHNGEYIAFLLEWLDPTKNDFVDTDKASDACAIQFPKGDFNATSPFMGHDGSPVVIFHWKAIWNRDIEKGFVDLEQIYPNVFTETYMFGKNIAKEAGNPLSQDNRESPAEQLTAIGFGTSTHSENPEIRAWGIKTDKGWKVMFSYKIDTNLLPNLKPNSKTGIGFAIWGGNNRDIGARKNYAPWQEIILE